MADDKLPPSSETSDFKSLASMNLGGNQFAQISFPLPESLQLHQSSQGYLEHAVEYYILARYSYFHRMSYAFMVNTFWAVEYLCLSVLVFKYTKDDLNVHQLPDYWNMVKEMVSPPISKNMGKFNDYIGKVQGYFSERYGHQTPARGKLVHTGKQPKVTLGQESKKFSQFAKVAPLKLDELDHFVNFMLHDVSLINAECFHYLEMLLASNENTELYLRENNYSVILPDRKYHGELR